jgi:hypothetical protein
LNRRRKKCFIHHGVVETLCEGIGAGVFRRAGTRTYTHTHNGAGSGEQYHRDECRLESGCVRQPCSDRRSSNRVLDIHRDNVRDECDVVGDQVCVLAYLNILQWHLCYWEEHHPVRGLDRELLLRAELGGEC